jgi:methyl-accepting chemotaxis protein
VTALYLGLSPVLSRYMATTPNDATWGLVDLLFVLCAVGGLSAFSSYQIRLALVQLDRRNTALSAQSAREQSLMRHMRETATRISSTAAEIAAGAAAEAARAGEQAAGLAEVSATIEELHATAGQIAEAAGAVAEAAVDALHSAAVGQEVGVSSMAGMERISARINDIVARNLSLAAQSQHITEILHTMSEIAAKTHILALNASVESAGAGEAGTRFAVVAAEVKKLAQRSATATREVQTIVGQNQAAIAAAVMATEEGLKEGEEGQRLAREIGTTQDAIITVVERTARQADSISLATQQQRTASAQVVLTMREMVQMTQAAASSSQQTLAAVTHLQEVAAALGRVAPPTPDGDADAGAGAAPAFDTPAPLDRLALARA